MTFGQLAISSNDRKINFKSDERSSKDWLRDFGESTGAKKR